VQYSERKRKCVSEGRNNKGRRRKSTKRDGFERCTVYKVAHEFIADIGRGREW